MNWTTDKPTEAGWTRNAPTKEGWYWWQRTENDNPVVVWVNAFHPDKQLRAEMISGRRELLTHFTGLFKGPISPTDYQQGRVAGLQEAGDLHEQVNTYCDHEPKAGDGGMGVVIRYRDLIRQQATKLAQQAQEER